MEESSTSREQPVEKKKYKKYWNYDKSSIQWLEANYIRIFGLRNWTWKSIINGIITEHIKIIKSEQGSKEIDKEHVHLLWHTFLQVAGIKEVN